MILQQRRLAVLNQMIMAIQNKVMTALHNKSTRNTDDSRLKDNGKPDPKPHTAHTTSNDDSSDATSYSKSSLADVLKSICDDKSLSIFQLIATLHSNGEIILKKLGLTRKQYYSKISAMMKARLIKRQNGKYYLTTFGKVIYCCTTIAKNALDNYYNLKAIEAIEVSGLPNEEIGRIVDVLIDNPQVKEFVTKRC
jgi:hypothetical protein